MRHQSLPYALLLSLAALGAGCFAPDLADDGELAGTGGAEAGADAADDVDPAPDTGATGGQESGGETADDPTGDPEADDGTDGEPEDGTDGEPEDGTDGEPEDGTDGEPEDGTDDDTGSDGLVCDEPLGTEAHCLDCDDACADGETCTAEGCAAPADIGFSEPFAGIGGYPGRLWGFAVEVEQDAVLSALNFHAVGNGGDVQLALYSDEAGAPSELLAMTDVVEGYGPGTQSIDTDPIALAAGTYWVMARNDFPSQIGLNFDPDILPPFPLTAIFIDFDEPMPEQLVATETFNSYEVNLWITVLQP